jgi:phospholipase/carboxylesterase
MNKFSDDSQAIQSRDLIVKFIDEILEKYPIDKEKVTLLGFSQGTILSYSIALTYPEKIDRVVALSGYLNMDIVDKGFNTKDISKLRFFISHGVVDQVIPVEWARKAPQILKELGLETEYHEYPVGHGVTPQNFYDLVSWLKK